MKYFIRGVPLLALLALLVGVFQVVEPGKAQAQQVAQASILSYVDSDDDGDFDDLEDIDTATSKDPGRRLTLRVVDTDGVAGTIRAEITSDSSDGCEIVLVEGVAGTFERTIFLTDEEDKDPDTDTNGDGEDDNDGVLEDLRGCGDDDGDFTLTGTVSTTDGSNIVTGTGTQFLTQVRVGESITIGDETKIVTAIASNTSLEVDTAFAGADNGVTAVVNDLDVVLLVNDGDTVELEYLDATFSSPRRDRITIDNDAPQIRNFSPDDESFIGDDEFDAEAEVVDGLGTLEPSVIRTGVYFIQSDIQCTNADLFHENGDPRFTVPAAVAAGSDLLDITNLECGVVTANVVLRGIPVDYDVIEDADDNPIGFHLAETFGTTEDFEQFFLGVIAVDEAGNVSILDIDSGNDDRVFVEVSLDSLDPALDTGEARTGINFNSELDRDALEDDPPPADLDELDERFDEVYNSNQRNWIALFYDENSDLDGGSIDASDYRVTVDGDNIAVEDAVWHDEDPVDLNLDDDFEDAFETIRRVVFLRLAEDLPMSSRSAPYATRLATPSTPTRLPPTTSSAPGSPSRA